MTKMKTLRESSKRLSTRYKFKRQLQLTPEVINAFSYRDERINRIKAVKDISIIEPLVYEVDDTGDIDDRTIPTIHITKNDTKWPFRIEYIEQILDVEELWVVIADRTNSKDGTGPTVEKSFNQHGISLDLLKIEKPRVVIGYDLGLHCKKRKILSTEKELRSCEDEYWKPHSMLQGGYEPVWLQGKYPEQVVDLYLCNILPSNLSLYNATFYNRDVAHLYLDSLSESIKRFVGLQSSPYH